MNVLPQDLSPSWVAVVIGSLMIGFHLTMQTLCDCLIGKERQAERAQREQAPETEPEDTRTARLPGGAGSVTGTPREGVEKPPVTGWKKWRRRPPEGGEG